MSQHQPPTIEEFRGVMVEFEEVDRMVDLHFDAVVRARRELAAATSVPTRRDVRLVVDNTPR